MAWKLERGRREYGDGTKGERWRVEEGGMGEWREELVEEGRS